MSKKQPEGYQDQTRKTWTPVVAPAPVFDSAEDAIAYREAVAENPRQPGDDVCAWLERIGAAAREKRLGRLPYRDSRIPGEDDE